MANDSTVINADAGAGNGAGASNAADANANANANAGQGGGDNGGNGTGGNANDNVAETPDAKRARLKRQLEQHDKKYGFSDDAKPNSRKNNKSSELDYGEKAFLVSNGIKGAEETKLVQDIMESTGKSLEDVLESKYFQAEIKEMRDAKASQDATPSGNKTGQGSARDTVEYWISKGELPPADQTELRRKVVNAKIAKETTTNPFTDTPVIK